MTSNQPFTDGAFRYADGADSGRLRILAEYAEAAARLVSRQPDAHDLAAALGLGDHLPCPTPADTPTTPSASSSEASTTA